MPLDIKQMEEHLMRLLKSSNLDKETLRQYSSAAVQVQKSGLVIERILRYGIPFPDGIRVVGRLPHRIPPKFLEEILAVPGVNGLRGFPRGIPKPEFLDIVVNIGNDIEQQYGG